MNGSLFESAAWFRAAQLVERQDGVAAVPEGEEGAARTREAQRLLERWRNREPFTSTPSFQQRLEVEGLTEARLEALLTEPPEELKRRLAGQAPWLVTLQEAFSQPVSSEPFPLPDSLQGVATVGFLEWVRPLLERSRARVKARLQELARGHSGLLFDLETVEPLLFVLLPVRLLKRINRMLVLEMHVARLQGKLRGETGAERFRSFVELLRDPGYALPLFQEYAVLARLCVEGVDQWEHSSVELITRLLVDGPELRERVLPPEPGTLVELTGDAGDQHHDGRSVQILTFSSGVRLVYKPRSLEVDRRYQELLTWLAQRGDGPSFRQLRLLPRDGYGWSEYVDARPCESEESLQRFYYRQGAQMCLIHHLAGMDVHYENLIAEGEHPVLVDLETLFHPQISDRMKYTYRGEQLFVRMVDYSVSRIFMLPMLALSPNPENEVETSGMGSPDGKIYPRAQPYWENTGEDTMQQRRKPLTMVGAKNLPTVRGEPVQPERYVDSLCEGFEWMYRVLHKERDTLLSPDGPLRPFRDTEIRILLRSTQIYYTILLEGFHPDLLRDGLERDRYFDALWMGVRNRPFVERLIAAERRALHRGDVPRFTTRPDSRDLYSGPGELHRDVLWRSGMEVCEDRLRGMEPADLERHLWWIRSTLTCAQPEAPQSEPPPRPAIRQPVMPVERPRLLAAARVVGDQIATLAFNDEGVLGWMGIRQLSAKRWGFAPAEFDLFGGMPGIALFLAQLGRLTGEEHFTRMARNAGDTLRKAAEYGRNRLKILGGFSSGWGSILYALTHLGVLLEDQVLLADAEAHTESPLEFLAQDTGLDVIAGSAGCIGALLALHHTTGSTRALAAAVRCGEHLLATRQPQVQGSAWMTVVPSTQPLSGFAHGASGMAWALQELAAASGQARFSQAAQEALAYERTLFRPEALTWVDTRPTSPTLTAWCYGAPGIGLARMRLLRHLDSPVLREELRAAVAGTLQRGFGLNDSLCHGDLGNLEIIASAQAMGEAPGAQPLISSTLEDLLARTQRREWRCATPLYLRTPGLMLGLAGIGWSLLRFASPEEVPSVLTLDPPAVKRGMMS